MSFKSDYLIIGAGIVGLSIARELKNRYPLKSVTIIEKENDIACHGSGRNSGVLHAGFYYTENSLKARFTRDGNRELTEYCEAGGLSINKCGKVVVAQNESELESLFELEARGRRNGVDVTIIDEKELAEIDPNAKTFEKALYSPTTSTVDPIEVCNSIKNYLIKKDVNFFFSCEYKKKLDSTSIIASGGMFESGLIINASGLYADKVAKDFGYGKEYSIIPFKGIYLKYNNADRPVKTNIYPVPDMDNPFLGVHYTVTVDNTIKIGPTAIPSFWRENYRGFENFKLAEFLQVLYYETKLFLTNSFGFRSLALKEMRKYRKSYFIGLASEMVKGIDKSGFREWTRPGVRAQLLNTKNLELVQDFIVEGDSNSVHILNAVSPAFTSSFPFCRWVVDEFVLS